MPTPPSPSSAARAADVKSRDASSTRASSAPSCGRERGSRARARALDRERAARRARDGRARAHPVEQHAPRRLRARLRRAHDAVAPGVLETTEEALRADHGKELADERARSSGQIEIPRKHCHRRGHELGHAVVRRRRGRHGRIDFGHRPRGRRRHAKTRSCATHSRRRLLVLRARKRFRGSCTCRKTTPWTLLPSRLARRGRRGSRGQRARRAAADRARDARAERRAARVVPQVGQRLGALPRRPPACCSGPAAPAASTSTASRPSSSASRGAIASCEPHAPISCS